ncbi:MAG: site-specific integrase [Acetobacter sp.]|nr:site-specific integrase [Bacteroides sp.]MCM1340952.1 site-specific integrase [Acetobacter sp.]MCM1432492.1 site-specific integrase [Clostridiales bacterium]
MPRRGENIYKRKDGRWEARYVKEVLPNGKKKYGSVYADNYKDVKVKQQQCLLHPTKAVCNSMNMTVNVLIAEWLDSIKNQVKPNTYQKYESVCKNHIVNEIGSVLVKLISNYTIINVTNKLKEKNLSAKSVNDILIVLGLAFKYAEEEYEIITPRIRYLKEEKREMRVLSVNEQLQLTTYLNLNIDIYKFGILLALYTGIRVGELCALQWDDITDDYIQINKTMTRVKTDNKTAIKIGSPKSDSSKRLIPTPQCLLPLISQLKSIGYVLSTDKLDYTEPRLMQIKFEKIIAESGLEKTNFHVLRHTFATRCVEAGVDVKTLSEILGHSDVKTTLNRYVHSSFELKQKSMKQFELSLIS